ncbi:MAG: hypothetical protein ABIH63_04160 [archaeon]
MQKIIIPIILLFLVGGAHGEEVFPGVSYSFHFSWVSISKNEVRLEHSQRRDLLSLEFHDHSVFAIDFECDGVLDIVYFGSKSLSREDPCFAELEEFLNRWKVEAFYYSIVRGWDDWKKKGGAK